MERIWSIARLSTSRGSAHMSVDARVPFSSIGNLDNVAPSVAVNHDFSVRCLQSSCYETAGTFIA